MRTKYAKGILYAIAYDIKHLLDMGESPKDVYAMAKKKIDTDFKDRTWVKVNWESHPTGRHHRNKPTVFTVLEEKMEYETTSHVD